MELTELGKHINGCVELGLPRTGFDFPCNLDAGFFEVRFQRVGGHADAAGVCKETVELFWWHVSKVDPNQINERVMLEVTFRLLLFLWFGGG